MTRDEILAIPAGRELDELVAKFMGVPERTFKFAYEAGNFNYSISMSAAWKVVEKMKEKLWWCRIGTQAADVLVEFENSETVGSAIEAMTAPEAICKAALIAVMEGQAHDL